MEYIAVKYRSKELISIIAGDNSIRVGMTPQMRAQADKKIAKAIAGESEHKLAKGIMKSQAFWMTSTDIVGDMFPSEINSGGVDISTGNLFADGTKIVAGCKGFKKACIVAFAAGYVSLLAESVSEPRTPIVGINSLGIKIPYVPLEEEQYSAKLSDAAFKYYLMISRGGLVTDPGPRLSMVSPCKATLTVEVREKPVRCYFDKCVVPDYMTEQIKSDCGGDTFCEDEASETYMADNCGYANPNNNIFSKTLAKIMDVRQSLRPKNQFYIFGEQLMEVKVHDEDMLKIDKFFPVDLSAGGVNYYRNLKDIDDTEGHYVDFGGYEQLKNLRATKICNTQSAGALVGEEVLGAAWDTVTLNKDDYFSVTSYQISNVITVTADKQDYNGKSNYCYQTEKKVAAYGRLANMVVWTGLDIAVMGATAKFGPWGLAAAAGAHFITGSASVFVDQKLEDKSVTMWPGEI